MNTSKLLKFLSTTALVVGFSTLAHAQATRTWVSGVGDDANPCSRTAPCKTWPGAISKTAPAGEIDALDPGGFGTVTITKGITLDGGGGVVASILASGTAAINVNAGGNDVVTIRNLSINGVFGGTATAGTNGIVLNTAGALIVEKCDIFGFTNNGIAITPTVPTKVSISDTYITNTATVTGNAAILVRPTGSGNASVAINRTVMHKQLNGVFADGTGGGGVAHVQLRDSQVTASGNSGIVVSSAGAAFNADVINTLIAYSVNTGAATAGGSATLKLGGNTITNNVTGVSSSGGTLQSFKNNQITDNTNDGTPITAVPGYSGTGQ